MLSEKLRLTPPNAHDIKLRCIIVNETTIHQPSNVSNYGQRTIFVSEKKPVPSLKGLDKTNKKQFNGENYNGLTLTEQFTKT